jgi:hypothetical protein
MPQFQCRIGTIVALNLAWAIVGRSFLQSLRAWIVQMANAIPILFLAFGMLVLSFVGTAVAAARSACAESADPTTVIGSVAFILVYTFMLRCHVPMLPELRALPGGDRFRVPAEVVLACLVAAPMLGVAMVGVAWAWVTQPGVAVAVRGLVLVLALFMVCWASLAKRGSAVVGGVVAGILALASLAFPGMAAPACAAVLLIAALALLVRLPPASPTGGNSTWRPRIGGMLVDVCSNRQPEIVLRCVVAASLFCIGAFWVSGWGPIERPAGLVLVAGFAVLPTYGCLRIIYEYRCERSELVASLPISEVRWAIIACSIPIVLHVLFLVALVAVLSTHGSAPAWIVFAAIVSLVGGLVSLWFSYVYLGNGMFMAVMVTILATRVVGAVQA